MLEFDFEDSQEIINLDLQTKLIPNDIIKLGVVIEKEHNCLAKITDVEVETFKFKLITECNIPLNIGQKFAIIFMKETGVYKIPVYLEEIIKEKSNLILKVRTTEKAYKIQNRSYFRLNIYKRISFTKITKFDTQRNSQEYKGVAENISAVGVKLVTNCTLLKNEYLNLDFSFAGFSFSEIIGKVTRVRKKSTTHNGPSYYEAGIEFIWEDLSDQDELSNWLNRQTYKCL